MKRNERRIYGWGNDADAEADLREGAQEKKFIFSPHTIALLERANLRPRLELKHLLCVGLGSLKREKGLERKQVSGYFERGWHNKDKTRKTFFSTFGSTHRRRLRLKGHLAGRCVCKHAEVGGAGRTHGRWPQLDVDLLDKIIGVNGCGRLVGRCVNLVQVLGDGFSVCMTWEIVCMYGY